MKLHLLDFKFNVKFGNEILMMANILMTMISPIISSRFLARLKILFGFPQMSELIS